MTNPTELFLKTQENVSRLLKATNATGEQDGDGHRGDCPFCTEQGTLFIQVSKEASRWVLTCVNHHSESGILGQYGLTVKDITLSIPNDSLPPDNKGLGRTDKEGYTYFCAIRARLVGLKAVFLKGEEDKLFVVLPSRKARIPLVLSDIRFEALFQESAGITTATIQAKIAFKLLLVYAYEKAREVCHRRFSAMSPEGDAVYIPMSNGRLLKITATKIEGVENGADRLWVDHPFDATLQFTEPNMEDVREGLELFEKLLVESQSCRVPGMSWLTAMNEALFPFIRDETEARAIFFHVGSSQQGKTTAAIRFLKLLGLGNPHGAASVAGLRGAGDAGLIVSDNKEHQNFNEHFKEHLIFSATGADPTRANQDGSMRALERHRPVLVVTSIEGIPPQEELYNRCIEVEYLIREGQSQKRTQLEREVVSNRHKILSAFALVLQRYLQIKNTVRECPRSVQSFNEHYDSLCTLLEAYQDLAKKPDGWASKIIGVWAETITKRRDEGVGSPLEIAIYELLNHYLGVPEDELVRKFPGARLDDTTGTLLVTQAGPLWARLNRDKVDQLPKGASALARRLKSLNLGRFKLLSYTEFEPGASPVPLLSEKAVMTRKGDYKPLGFFAPTVTKEDDNDGQ